MGIDMAYFYWNILEYLLIAAGALQSRALISQESAGTPLLRLGDQTVRPGTAAIQSPLARLACSLRQGELHNTFTSLIIAPLSGLADRHGHRRDAGLLSHFWPVDQAKLSAHVFDQ
jgi:hypothetical protein